MPIGEQVTITVCGKSYDVRPTFAMLVRLEKRIGSILALMARIGDGKGVTAEECAWILADAAAKSDRKAPDFAKVLDAICESPQALADATGQAMGVITACLPGREANEEEAASPPAAG